MGVGRSVVFRLDELFDLRFSIVLFLKDTVR
jgi:hypothetical protein